MTTTPEARAPLAAGEVRALERRRLPLPERGDLAAMLLLAVYGMAMYWPGVRIGLLSDGWALLGIASRSWGEVLTSVTNYHSIPVTNVLNATLWRLFGLHQSGYQAANLIGIVVVAWGIYLLGKRLFPQTPVSLLAGLVFLSNASFYEVPFWPGVGNLQSLAGLFILAGVAVATSSVRRGAAWAALLAVIVTLALLTYEPALSLAPVVVLAAWTAAGTGADRAVGWRATLWRMRWALVASALAVAVLLGLKAYLARSGHPAFFLPTSLDALRVRLFYAVRACIGIFSLRGSDPVLVRTFGFGGAAAYGSAYFHVMLAFWLLALAGVAAALLWKGPPVVRLLAAWFALHLTIVAAAIIPVSRHFFLAAIPAALLAAWLLWRGAVAAHGFLARRAPGSLFAAPYGAAVLAFAALLVAAAGGKRDLDGAARVHRQAHAASNQAQRLALAALGPGEPPLPALVNMPAILAADGYGAFAFVNGIHQMLVLSSGGRYRFETIELFHTYDRTVEGVYASASRPITFAELDRLVRDPQRLVLMFDRDSRTVVQLDANTWRLPSAYTRATTPQLRWEAGDWPWMRVHADLPFEMTLAHAPGDWVAMRFLRDASTAFALRAGAAPVIDVAADASGAPSWPTVTGALPGGESVTTLVLAPARELWIAGVWSFTPPRAYSPLAAPFLTWIPRPQPAMHLERPIELPLDAGGCAGGCTMTVEYLAEAGRELQIAVAGAPPQRLAAPAGAPPAWLTASWPIAGTGTLVAAIAPQGTLPPQLRTLRIDPPAGEAAATGHAAPPADAARE